MNKTYPNHGTRNRPSRARRQYRELRDFERSALPEPRKARLASPSARTVSATVDDCVSLCYRNPGWMTPAEAVLAMEAASLVEA